MRKFTENELVLATHNQGKVREMADMLGPYVRSFTSAHELGFSVPEETGTTFHENAAIKALASAKASGKIALADDSGLSVSAIGGQPGVYSADWAEREDGSRDFEMAMNKVHNALADSEDRSAAFICVLALAWPDGHVESFEGRITGSIVWPMRGSKGFGYDPIFVPEGHDRTFAEMDPVEKHQMSHRARAFEKMVESCLS